MKKKDLSPRDARNEAEIFAELQQLCSSPGYVHAIAFFCWRDNLIRYDGKRITEEDLGHQYSYERLLRTEISTLVGLVAKVEFTTALPTPNTFQHYVDQSEALLHEMHMSLQKPWLSAFDALARNPSKASALDPFKSAAGLREPIFYGGESAYIFQYEELSIKRYSADDDWFKSHVGFTIGEACTAVRGLRELQIQKMLTLHDSMRSSHPDKWAFLPAFVFNAHEVQQATGFTLEKVERILGAFTADPKKANGSFSSLSDFNEMNAAPIFRIADDSYILFQAYSLIESLYESPFFWMIGDKSYADTASRNRGLFLEQFLTDRLVRVFGRNHVFRNVNIYKGRERYAEVDVLVIYGDQAIVIQAKSKRLTIEARKGNDLQLKGDFKKAIHNSYDQALLCSQALLEKQFRFVSFSGDEIVFKKRPEKIFPICVVADHFPALAAQVQQFLKVNSTESVRPPIVTDVFFLDVLTELLDKPLHLLNYLALRARFGHHLLVNQELTILGYHLKHNLWLETSYNLVNLGDDFSGSIDIAMYARRLGLPGERIPKGILTRFDGSPLGRLISEFEINASPEFVSLGLFFLQLSSDAAMHINNGFVRLVSAAADDGKLHDFSIPHEAEKSGVTVHINPASEEVARTTLSHHCRLRKYDTKSDSWYGLLLAPGTGEIRGALVVKGRWKADVNLDSALRNWERKPMVPLKSLSRAAPRRKVGRNEHCPCGSGLKYKKCCLDRA